MTEPLVIYELADQIATLTLNNPSRRHALSSEVLAALKDQLGSIREDSAVKGGGPEVRRAGVQFGPRPAEKW